MLKHNQEKEDVRYWALKHQVDEFEVQFIALQRDKSSLHNMVFKNEKMRFLKLKEKI